jgi:hypothetical protein
MLLVLATDLLYAIESERFPPLLDINLIGQILIAASVIWLGIRNRLSHIAWLLLLGGACSFLGSMSLELPRVRRTLSLGDQGLHSGKAIAQLFLNDLAVGLLIAGFSASLIVLARRQQQLSDESRKREGAEAQFGRLLWATGVFAWEIDIDADRFTFLGPQAGEILGYPREEMFQPGFWSRKVHPDDRQRGTQWIRRLLRGENAGEIDFRFERPDGRFIWLRDVGGMGPDAGEGRVIRGFAIDVTRARQAQTELAESEERFRRAFEDGPLGVAFVDREGRFLRVNPALAAMLGYEPEELVGRRFTEISHPEEASSDVDVAMQILRNAVPGCRVEKRYLTKNGQIVWGSLTATVVRDAEGNFLYGLGMIEDIGERKAAEAALQRAHDDLERRVAERTQELQRANRLLQDEIGRRRETEQALLEREGEVRRQFNELETLYRTAPVGLCLLDPELRYLRINDRLASFNGRAAEEHIGKSIREVIPGLAPVIEPIMRRVQVTGDAVTDVEISGGVVSSADPESTWLVSYYPVASSDGRRSIGCIVQDTTDHKRMEAQLAKHQSELAQATRLGVLGELSAGLAHELNQPLSAIANYSKGCVRRLQALPEIPGAVIETLEEIDREARRASEIIRRLRDLVRKREPRMTTIDLNELVQDAFKLAAVDLKYHGTRLKAELAKEMPPIFGDPILLEQVLLNLIRNALEALANVPPTEREVSVRTTVGDTTITLEVIDNGAGPACEKTDQWFEPFFTTREGGLGMGLPISRSIVEAHGGQLRARSGEPRGTVLVMTLPIAQNLAS